MSKIIFDGYRFSLDKNQIYSSLISVKTLEEKFFRNLYKFYRNTNKSLRLLRILCSQFGSEFSQIIFIKLIPTLTTFLGPLLLDRLIKFATNADSLPSSHQWHGYFYAFSMFFLFIIESILNSYSDYRIRILGLKIRSCLMASIYHRLLLMKNSFTEPQSKKKSKHKSNENNNTSGQIINLMSNDTQRIFDYVKIVNLFWICPLQITIAIYLLWQLLGYGSLAGLTILLLLLPLNTLIGARIRLLQSKLLQYKDNRFKLLTETLNGIRAIKLYAWEQYFHKRIEESRKLEYKNLCFQALYSTAITFAFISAPFFVALSSFSLFLYLNHDGNGNLDAQKAFVSLAIFNIIRRPVAFIPQLITNTMLFSVSLQRISKFLYDDGDKLQQITISPTIIADRNEFKMKKQIVMKNCNFTWTNQDKSFQLTDIDLNIQKFQSCAIIGSIGAGKSSLLAAILGQMKLNSHEKFEINGEISYVPQNSWIQSGTIRENILFGNEYDPIKYWKTIESCSLIDDLKQMKMGDKTLVGENGDNLSGGQRQRISLARACYHDADIYLFDDPLSALDSNVSNHIFRRIFCGNNCHLNVSNQNRILVDKIRIFTTNNMALLPNVDHIILIDNGRIVAQGNYQDLIKIENEFTKFLTNYFSCKTAEINDDLSDDLSNTIENDNDSGLMVDEEEDYNILNEMITQLEQRFRSFSRSGSMIRRISLSDKVNGKSSKKFNKNDEKKKKCHKNRPKKSSNTLNDSDLVKTGSISFNVYWKYIRSIGLLSLLLIIINYTIGHFFVILTNLWLSSWSNDSKHRTNNSTSNHSNTEWINNLFIRLKLIDTTTSMDQTSTVIDPWTRLFVYAVLGLLQTIFILIATLLLNLSCLHGSQMIHKSMLKRLMNVPLSFFDEISSGKIINRFDKDIDLADTTLISSLRLFMIEIFRTIALFTIIIIGTNSPILILLFMPLIVCYFLIYKYYVSTSRQLIRIESQLRTPIYQQFNETYSGLIVIQTFKRLDMFLAKIFKHIDQNMSTMYMSIAASKWLSLRLECLGNIIILITSISCVMLRENITPGMVGLCIATSLSITSTLNFLIQSSIDLENNIVTIERLVEYTNLPQEIHSHSNDNSIVKSSKFLNFPRKFFRTKSSQQNTNDNVVLCSTNQTQNWLKNGSIIFDDYSAKYDNSSELCLKNVTISIKSGEKIGIVGRTGAGKSSFSLSLFRLIQQVNGSIQISNININNLNLKKLRSALTIIPQKPLLFTDTLRSNIDPLNLYSDEQIIEALKKTSLSYLIPRLYQMMTEQNFKELSYGQKQLLCLTRAILKKSKIIILDEATSSIDPLTDQHIQEIINNEFNDCTIITIAHRLNTIISYDRIVVFDNGQILESDTPSALLSNKSTLFYRMIAQQE